MICSYLQIAKNDYVTRYRYDIYIYLPYPSLSRQSDVDLHSQEPDVMLIQKIPERLKMQLHEDLRKQRDEPLNMWWMDRLRKWKSYVYCIYLNMCPKTQDFGRRKNPCGTNIYPVGVGHKSQSRNFCYF